MSRRDFLKKILHSKLLTGNVQQYSSMESVPEYTVCNASRWEVQNVAESLHSDLFRYFLRATISRRLNDISKEMEIVVQTLSTYPELNSSIKMEVGIEDCLHIEFEYNKSK